MLLTNTMYAWPLRFTHPRKKKGAGGRENSRQQTSVYRRPICRQDECRFARVLRCCTRKAMQARSCSRDHHCSPLPILVVHSFVGPTTIIQIFTSPFLNKTGISKEYIALLHILHIAMLLISFAA